MLAVPKISIERTLAQLRWRPADFFEESLLRRIVAHTDYWLVVRDGEPMLAPDDERARRLAAVFTSGTARDVFLREEHVAADSVEMRHLDGRALFSELGKRHYVGIVFNCSGPERPLAFVSELIDRARPFCAMSRDRRPMTDAEGIDFDAMAADAYPNQLPGPREAVDMLWRTTYELPEWFAVMHAVPAGVLFTRRDRDRQQSMFLFTDRKRAELFIEANDVHDREAACRVPARVDALVPATVLDWSRQGKFPLIVERVHFNFGGPGWFSPADNLARLFDHLKLQTA